ncbi:hypothetical protein T484DRAFT_1923060 [Baffinella frigidus]|nr:hypothetical protein T484DRAFT_1923060 [Cryptophyta sp. CCMP2293]
MSGATRCQAQAIAGAYAPWRSASTTRARPSWLHPGGARGGLHRRRCMASLPRYLREEGVQGVARRAAPRACGHDHIVRSGGGGARS